MTIVVATVSIYILAGAAVLANRLLRTSVCPVCVGVSGTWIWMLAARAVGAPLEDAIILLLMGGSVVGIAYWLERRTASSSMAFKLLFIPAGMLAAWALVMSPWAVFVAAALPGVVSLLLLRQKKHVPRTANAKALQERMKQCC